MRLTPRLPTRLVRSSALHTARSLGGSIPGLLTPRISTGIARSEALYRSRSLRGSPRESLAPGLARPEALYNGCSPQGSLQGLFAPRLFAKQYKTCSLQPDMLTGLRHGLRPGIQPDDSRDYSLSTAAWFTPWTIDWFTPEPSARSLWTPSLCPGYQVYAQITESASRSETTPRPSLRPGHQIYAQDTESALRSKTTPRSETTSRSLRPVAYVQEYAPRSKELKKQTPGGEVFRGGGK